MTLKRLERAYSVIVKAKRRGSYLLERKRADASIDKMGFLRVNLYYSVQPLGKSQEYQVILSLAPEYGVEELGRLLYNGQTKVYCSCEDFNYRLAYALQRRYGIVLPAPRVRLALRIPPKKTNPKLKTRLCKHLIMVLRSLRSLRLQEALEGGQKMVDWPGS